MNIIYSFFIFWYAAFLNFAAVFNPKAKLWIQGRKNILEKLKSKISHSESSIIWFHCASLGEFEQGRPLMESIKNQEPTCKILLTFFSPSGYEIRKNYTGVDWVFYLPVDTVSNAKKFIEIVKPKKAIFVKYEFWFNYLDALCQKNIPTYFISLNVRPDHYFFKVYGAWALAQLKKVTHFFVQNQTSFDLLNKAGITQCTIAGDTRFDRVLAISKEAKSIPLIEKFCSDKKVIVAGSTWREDEKLLVEWMLKQNAKNKVQNSVDKKLCFIIAPHEIDAASLREVESIFSALKTIRYSKLEMAEQDNFEVLIIDNMGMLSSLFKYATIAYIGGGFGKGIHNILEAAVYGKPVLFGPNYSKFEEAKQLINRGGATSVANYKQLEEIGNKLLTDEKKYREQSLISQTFVHENAGAVEKIVKMI